MEKVALNIPCFGCILQHFVFVFILISYAAFGSFYFINLLCWKFEITVYKKKIRYRNFGGRDFRRDDSPPYSQKFIPEITKKYALLAKNTFLKEKKKIFKESVQKWT